MRSDFRPDKLKKAKWILTKNYEMSMEKQKTLDQSRPEEKKGFLSELKKHFSFSFLRLWW